MARHEKREVKHIIVLSTQVERMDRCVIAGQMDSNKNNQQVEVIKCEELAGHKHKY